MDAITIPPPEQLRRDIAAKCAELRAMRELLRMAEAAVRAGITREQADAREAVCRG
jgi:hypothetical protein